MQQTDYGSVQKDDTHRSESFSTTRRRMARTSRTCASMSSGSSSEGQRATMLSTSSSGATPCVSASSVSGTEDQNDWSRSHRAASAPDSSALVSFRTLSLPSRISTESAMVAVKLTRLCGAPHSRVNPSTAGARASPWFPCVGGTPGDLARHPVRSRVVSGDGSGAPGMNAAGTTCRISRARLSGRSEEEGAVADGSSRAGVAGPGGMGGRHARNLAHRGHGPRCGANAPNGTEPVDVNSEGFSKIPSPGNNLLGLIGPVL